MPASEGPWFAVAHAANAASAARNATGAWADGWWAAAAHQPSPNVNPRPVGTEVSLAVVHSISLPPGVYGGDEVRQLFTNQLNCDAHPYFDALRGLRVSAHFVVRRDGSVLQFASCDVRAWHAGVSQWQGRDQCNDWSIGIELEGLEGHTFAEVQYPVLACLIHALAARYPLREVVGHEHVAPGRKRDPGMGFLWHRLQLDTMRVQPHGRFGSAWAKVPGHPGLVRLAGAQRP